MVDQKEILGLPKGDRRLCGRFVSRFPAKFKDARDDFGEKIYLRNFSAGGIKITTRERLYINDGVILEVMLSDERGPMIFRGEIVWVRNRDPEIWDAGLKFYKVVLMDMWRLSEFVETNSSL
jgi:hypothetical protein